MAAKSDPGEHARAPAPAAARPLPVSEEQLRALIEADLVQSLVTGGALDWKRTWETAAYLGWPGLPDTVLVVAVDLPGGASRRARQLALRGALAVLRHELQGTDGGACIMEGEHVTVAAGTESTEAALALALRLREQADAAAGPGAVVTAAVSGCHADPAELPRAYATAVRACESRFWSGGARVLTATDADPGELSGGGFPDTAAVQDALAAADAPGLAAAVDDYLRGLAAGRAAPGRARQGMLALTVALAGAALQAGVPAAELAEFQLEALTRIATGQVLADVRSAAQATARTCLERVLGRRADRTSPGVESAMAYVRRYYHRPCTVQDAASVAHVSPYHFCRLFKRETGQTFGRFLTHVRMTEAERLLKTTRLPVEEVARRVGYANASAFCARFRQATGMTPAALRRAGSREHAAGPPEQGTGPTSGMEGSACDPISSS